MYITDINEASLENAKHNARINGVLKSTEESTAAVAEVKRVNWLDPTSFPSEKADIILGSDLVYDSKIISILIPAITAMLTTDGQLLYSCLASERAGMDDFIPVMPHIMIFL